MTLRALGYGAFFGASYMICLYLSFPWTSVKERVLQQASKQMGRSITARSLKPSWITGFRAEQVEIELDGDAEPITLDRVHVRASLIDFLTGGYGGSIRIPVAKGRIDADISAHTSVFNGDFSIRDIELALVPALKDTSGLSLSGTVDLRADVNLELKEPNKSQGQIDLRISSLETLKGSKAANFPVPEMSLGNLDWSIPIEKGKVLVKNQTLRGPDLELILDGEITLAKPFDRSVLNLSARFKPTAAFLRREALIGQLLNLNNVKRYKSSDGFYNYRVTGTIKRPRARGNKNAR